MKEKAHCLECGLVKSAGPHATDHDFVAPPKAGFGQKPRQALAPRSEKRQRYYTDERIPAVIAAVGDGRQPCPVKAPGCTRIGTDLHERASRGRFGGLPAAVEADAPILVCRSCNGYISQHSIWARENGWLMSNTQDGTRATPRMPPRRSQQ